MQDDDGNAKLVKDEAFTDKIRQQGEKCPHLVFLAACHSATRSTLDAFAGLGPKLIQAGIPAVVAMQDVVDMAATQCMTPIFYKTLMEYGAVDRALNTARRNLDAAWHSDAYVPTLLMRLDKGQVWLDMEAADLVERVRKALGDIYRKFGNMWLERLRAVLRLCRDTSTYNENIRTWAGILLDALEDSPAFEQLCRDVPWLLLCGMVLSGVKNVAVTVASVSVVTELLCRPRGERESSTQVHPSAKKEPGGRVGESSEKEVEPRLSAEPRAGWEPELVFVRAGKFLMGTTKQEAAALRRQFDEPGWYKFEWETPQRPIDLPDYYIGKYPVTNAQYRAFAQETGHDRMPYYWKNGQFPSGQDDHPVRALYWKEAVAYCTWLTEKMQDAGCKIKVWRGDVLVTEELPRASCIARLPTEAEWEKAARGTDGWVYPWGNVWDPVRCNHSKSGAEKDTTPVGAYSRYGGDSPYGCADMAGNVYEWTSTRWGSKWEEPQFRYPYHADDGREEMEAGANDYHVARGGGYWSGPQYLRCAFRHLRSWVIGYYDPGLRVCVAAPFSHPFGL